jgi:hypothetical protein
MYQELIASTFLEKSELDYNSNVPLSAARVNNTAVHNACHLQVRLNCFFQPGQKRWLAASALLI